MLDKIRPRATEPAEESTDMVSSLRARQITPPATILGMLPWQLFVVSIIVFVNVTLLGFFALIAFNKIDVYRFF
ncbi:MAG: hypothetical protein JNL09_02785 [Anaerolineales bacterium]|nr:hypothetical protein [Anaerolineales bacterium]